MPVTLADCSLVIDTAPQRDIWCAFEHLAALQPGSPPTVIFVGACRLVDVYRLSEGRTNSDWHNLFKAGGYVLVRIIATGERQEIIRFAVDHMRKLDPPPRCNRHGFNTRGSARAVTCNETGITYKTQREAAKALDVTQSAISQHLSGELRNVKGYTFRWASDAPHKRDAPPQSAPAPVAGSGTA